MRRNAALQSGVSFTALPLPSKSSLLQGINRSQIKYQKVHRYSQTATEALSLLKPIVKVGAKTSPRPRLKTGELRRLIKAWPKDEKEKRTMLTWLIQLLLVQK